MSTERTKGKIAEICDVSRETITKLEIYANLLERWNPKINLVSKTTLSEKWERHFLDSAQIWPLIPQNVKSLADIGSGAGFAGLVVAIIAQEKNPDLAVTLIESDSRKCAFMRNVAREVGASLDIRTDRIENIENLGVDVLTARALAPINDLLAYSTNILKPNGVCLFLKGEACAIELEKARESWVFQAHLTPSIIHPDGCVAKITGIECAK